MTDNLFGLTANLIDLCFLSLGKTGKFLNARGIRICFLIDLICLTYWMYIDIQRGLYSQGISCMVSMGICIYGFIRWGKIADKNRYKNQ
jgi:nicotinamide riboside transporter PnuC